MRQRPDPNPYENEDEDLELGTSVYEGSGLSVRALTAEEVQWFLDAHTGQPAQLLGSGWASLDLPPGHPHGVPRTPLGAEHEPPGPQPSAPAEPVAGNLGSPGRSARAQYRRRRAEELAAWTRSLVWRAPLSAAAGLAASVVATQAGLARAGLVGLVVATVVGWWLRFRPSANTRAWRRGANGERRTARLLAPWSGTVGRSCMIWPSPARRPTSTAMIPGAAVAARSDPNIDRPGCLEANQGLTPSVPVVVRRSWFGLPAASAERLIASAVGALTSHGSANKVVLPGGRYLR